MFDFCPSPPGRNGSLWPISQEFWIILCSVQNSTCVSEFKLEKSQEYKSVTYWKWKCYHFLFSLLLQCSCSRKMWPGTLLLISHFYSLGLIFFSMGTSMFLYFPSLSMAITDPLLCKYQLQGGSSLPGFCFLSSSLYIHFIFQLCYVLKLTQHDLASDCAVLWLSNISLWVLSQLFFACVSSSLNSLCFISSFRFSVFVISPVLRHTYV